ncbi:PTS sugar transporter subunit IIA [Lactobacillus sp.]|uniref:PTS sugar transporter subunit IIA n=1 Tax=Lactobacillus sp. TaxID=1591 RepID=UPI0019A7F34F|nr:PTS sugar transporter subunit IIA [Lactobacillus sp.]MBD5430671.1 PTS sugar transporter subunit IIA [Lactobacillus sp.]
MASEDLFRRDAVFVTDKTDRNEIFKDVYQNLLDMDLVKGDFIDNLIEREEKYPTGILTRPLHHDLPNVAIPHTEGKFVNTHLIVPVALKEPVSFNNMVNPTEQLQVKFLFMILNDDPDLHANILSRIMDFLASSSPDDLNELFNSTSPAIIYQMLEENFK